MKQFFRTIAIGLLLLPMLLYAGQHFKRPSLTNTKKILFPGIEYERRVLNNPRPIVVHIVSVDLTVPGIKVFVTPPVNQQTKFTQARTTSDFLQEFQLQLAMNANYFYPFRENTPWDYYPRKGEMVTTVGQAISNEKIYGQANANWYVSCIADNNIVQILKSGSCPDGTLQGVAGREMLVFDGKPGTPNHPQDKPYARVVIATNKQGDKVWLVAVDGKQPLYSEGLKKVELRNILVKLGVDRALNLDGGGSTTLVMEKDGQPRLLNSPSHTKIPMYERPVANHIGFYADTR
ncbi:MAG: phosphodiester glycosidase family protein [Calothrix sp. MO_192.B10]|nr:phosphodiester glycosidase family protein [Calothrix sp. MO_192.B10]